MEEVVRYLRALLMLELHSAQASAERSGTRYKPEVLLVTSGFSHKEIGEMLGKTPTAVAKVVSREKAKQGRASDSDSDLSDGGSNNG